MAIRYCGDLIIRVRYVDDAGAYHAVVRNTRGQLQGRVFVTPPAHQLRAVDCPDAYDDAAHAALSFVAEPRSGEIDGADYTDSGWSIRRKR